ncbi:MAG TPA: alkaline phosphatase family protein [Acidimicrobiales bacterium]|nr:alkaline phosphatase family protein [Acidimicrobiales bacterium]
MDDARAADDGAARAATEPMLPDYGGACLSSVVPALLGRGGGVPDWLPAPAATAEQVVLLVLDGLGWEQLQRWGTHAPTLASGAGGPITSVVPTTTATALTSIATGTTPADHGVIGYRMVLPAGTGGDQLVLNVLRWRAGTRDGRRLVPAPQLQPHRAFGGAPVPAVTRTDFTPTGFTAAHLAGSRIVGWRVPSTMVVEIGRQLRAGERFVYAYYDGVDNVAHEHGIGEHYLAELRAADRLVADIAAELPPGAALVVVSDHGQVEVGNSARLPSTEVMEMVSLISGEGRFRWLHAKPGAAADLAKVADEAHGHEAWVRTRQQMIDERWFGGPLRPEVADRLGDVALVARDPVAFLDPADTGETRLLARHGSLTAEEMLVPLLAFAP